MEAWEIYYWTIATLLCIEALFVIVYFVVFLITGKEPKESIQIVAKLVWCVTLALFIVAVVLSVLNR